MASAGSGSAHRKAGSVGSARAKAGSVSSARAKAGSLGSAAGSRASPRLSAKGGPPLPQHPPEGAFGTDNPLLRTFRRNAKSPALLTKHSSLGAMPALDLGRG